LNQKEVSSRQFSTDSGLQPEEYVLPKSVIKKILLIRRKGIAVFVDPLLISLNKKRIRKKCLLLHASLMISPYGSVLVCPMMDKIETGEIIKQPLDELWNGDLFQRIRKMVSQRKIAICDGCCVQRRTLGDHIKAPANFKRVFIRKVKRL
jgi:hypothetical protein